MLNKVSKHHSLGHYKWGSNCDGWNLMDEANFSVKQERMPAGASETLHYHEHSEQFFFILKGIATFEIEGNTIELKEQEGLQIKAGLKHRISNAATGDLEFILCSQPSTSNDRINV
jgi:mannose-6-phosphate isomerase-like protein (cupin superfamily)